ncbi:MAG: glycine cleavage system aminomethyltransferase GcvT [Dehalococcoidia bacterium]|nr:glycine cleavage system aminomethyltransferase GcvT [Dehalococcoidia bacterium]
MSEVHRTPLHAAHVAAGAKLIAFAGWEMPVSYTSIVREHEAVRAAVGMFDTSHMGQIIVAGPSAGAWLDWLLPNDIAGLAVGQARYSPLCAPDGGILDDLMVYRLDESVYLVVVNAAGRTTDLAWFTDHARDGVTIDPRYDDRAMIAVQGPAALTTIRPLCPSLTDDGDAFRSVLPRFGVRSMTVAGRRALVARTGYTGEDGVEIFLAAEDACAVWDALREAGVPPCGLGARDTLRLEAALPLYGADIDPTTTPYEAGLDWTVKLGKGDFIGRDALAAAKANGVARKLVGFVMTERGVARRGYPVMVDGVPVSVVTSGSYTPTVDRAIGMTYLPIAAARVGAAISVVIRDLPTAAQVTARPFYRRPDRRETPA